VEGMLERTTTLDTVGADNCAFPPTGKALLI